MNKYYLTSVILLYFAFNGYCQSSEIGKRWVMGLDPLFQIPIINQQYNSFNEKLPIGKDWINGFGFELQKYYPNKNEFLTISSRFFQREAIINALPVFFIRENGVQVNVILNRSYINKIPKYLDITKQFFGVGMSYTGIIDKRLNYFSRGYVQSSKELLNNHRVEGLLSLGLLEDVFKISEKTSLSKLNVVFRIPFFNASNTFNNKFSIPDSEIIEFVKSNSRKLSIEIQYSHLFDIKKNRRSNYEIKLDTTWNEVSDPIKTFFPPIVNNGLPTKSYYGNFYFEIMMYRSQDSIYVMDKQENFSLFKRFNGFGGGYTFNFFGNYSKDYSKIGTGGEIYNDGKGWRRNLFISAGYKQLILKANKNWVAFDVYAPLGIARAGLKLKNSKNRFEMAFGAGYQKLFGPQSFLNHVRTTTPILPTTSIFAAIGYQNNLIKIEYEMKDFNVSDQNKSINLVYSIGI